MTASIQFFPVGDGDMTLITLCNGKTILIDINIRKKADDDNEEDYPDVASMLKDRLDRDANDRLYVDVFMLSHPDQDHIAGLEEHFYLGDPSSWSDSDKEGGDKILIREMWSSPLTFRRAKESDGKLCDMAEKWKKEAKRRAKLYRDGDFECNEYGNYLRILGEDINQEKTSGLEDLVVKTGETLDEIYRIKDSSFSALLLSPKVTTKEEAEKLPGKNNSSIVMQISIGSREGEAPEVKFLTGGDAEVDIWERIWSRNKKATYNLSYDVLQAPHHCSLGVLSHDFYNDQKGVAGKGENCEIDKDAYSALSQANPNAFIIGSMSEPETKSGRGFAKKTYKKIANGVDGSFLCTMTESKDKPLIILIEDDGPSRGAKSTSFTNVPDKPEKGTDERGYA